MQFGVLATTLRHVIQLKKIEVVVYELCSNAACLAVLAAESEVRVGESCAE